MSTDELQNMRSQVERIQEDVTEIKAFRADIIKWFRGSLVGLLGIVATLAVSLYRIDVNAETIKEHAAKLQAPRFSREDYEREERSKANYTELYFKTILQKIEELEKKIDRR